MFNSFPPLGKHETPWTSSGCVGPIVSDLVDSESPVFYFHFSFHWSESWVAATL